MSTGWSCKDTSDKAAAEWPAYGRDPGGARHSPLAQITRDNVAGLAVAWTYRTGDVPGAGESKANTFQATPIYLDGTLYVSSGYNRVFALDPDTGAPRWIFDPKVDTNVPGRYLVSRGVSAWHDGKDDKDGDSACRRRLFVTTTDARLMAIDAGTGQPCDGFGAGGTVDLKEGIPGAASGIYSVSSPPAVVGHVVVVGSSIADNVAVDVPPGTVRGFDARTGARLWAWDPIPRSPADPGYEAWAPEDAARTRAANVWSVMTADPERDLVFLPTSSPSPDYYGGLRKGPGPHANSVVALRASTGKLVWAFQAIHHDLWDYDVPASPALTRIRRNGQSIDAVAVATKAGNLFFLDRDTGNPLWPIEERPVPPSDVPGEDAHPTQPFPLITPNLVGDTTLRPEDAWGVTDAERDACREMIAGARSEGIFTPPSLRGSVEYPGSLGGINWGGVAIDEGRGLLFTSVNRFGNVVRLIPRSEPNAPLPGEVIQEQLGTPYKVGRRLLSHPTTRLPCTKPPWGQLVAVDVATGTIRWEVPVGRFPGTEQLPGSETWGSFTLGGPIVTDGGLAFIGATQDDSIRAFDTDSGRELWKHALPAGGQATPMTYRSPKGRQFVVIAAGGSIGLGRPAADHLVAFALP
ncbi:pyrroloquinoline quinone-dependent dehydrogenase [Pendulispora rubella]|uniref:Pyrroloquinoline quinone-dependent dehydrogenase n=1 Tax=Pendulispora rubella TaxID=2741070 RepID=A0ABZ2L7W0_9BACT